jgi:hypothetical protein
LHKALLLLHLLCLQLLQQLFVLPLLQGMLSMDGHNADGSD